MILYNGTISSFTILHQLTFYFSNIFFKLFYIHLLFNHVRLKGLVFRMSRLDIKGERIKNI